MSKGYSLGAILVILLLVSSLASAESFGDVQNDPVPNLTDIRIYNVTGLSTSKKRTEGTLEDSGINKTFDLLVDGYGSYRFEFKISNEGSHNWTIKEEDILKHQGLNDSWSLEDAFYNISESRFGGNFTSGTVNWNTSKGGNLTLEGSNSSMTASYVVNISSDAPQTSDLEFLVNDTSNSSGSKDQHKLKINRSGDINVSIVRPPNNTVLQRNNTFTVTGESECLQGMCGKVKLSTLYNASEATSSLIPEGSGTPFYIEGVNSDTCSTNLYGSDTCRVNFTVNATGDVGSEHELKINGSSNISSVNQAESEGSLVEIKSSIIMDISWDTVSFGPVDPGAEDVAAIGNSKKSYNITVSEDSREIDNLYIKGSELVSQVNSNYTIKPQNLTHSFVEDPSTGINLSNGFQKVKSGISPGKELQNFFFMDAPFGLTTGEYRGSITFKANSTFEG